MRMFATISTFIARRLSTTDSAASSTTRPSTCDQVIQAALPASNVEPEEDAIVAKQTSRSAAGNHQEETNSGPHLDVQLIGFSAANNPPQNPHGKEVQPTGEELLNALDISETKRCILCQLPLDFTHATNPAVPSSNCLSETFDFHDLAADCVVGSNFRPLYSCLTIGQITRVQSKYSIRYWAQFMWLCSAGRFFDLPPFFYILQVTDSQSSKSCEV
ncbi:MAG: hypothetical protein MHMPM18_004626 [Marteilia pararefringens]